MTEFRKVLVAFALSVLAHASLFAALALMPVAAPVPAKPEPEEKQPLEVAIEAAPAAMVEETAPMLPDHLDPENLKKADKAPEKPKIMAGHDSEETPPQPDYTAALEAAATPAPAPTPSPKEEEVGVDALGNYGKAVGNAIGVRWEFYRKAQKDLPVGEVRIRFAIDAEGRVISEKIDSIEPAAPRSASSVSGRYSYVATFPLSQVQQVTKIVIRYDMLRHKP